MSGRYTIGIWTGNANGEGRPGLTGTLVAAPLLFDLFGRLPDAPLSEPPYDELVRAATCRTTGHLAGADCPSVDTVYVQEQGLRTPICPYHRTILLDNTGRWRVRPGQGGVSTAWLVLPPAMEHYYARRDPGYRPLPPYQDGGMEDLQAMEVLYPEQGARLFIPTELDGTQGKAVVLVTHRELDAVVEWDLDGSYAGRTTGDHRMALSPGEGTHRLTLTDQHGNRSERHFTVVASPRAKHSE
jgi:penicillin-binding protein 1C